MMKSSEKETEITVSGVNDKFIREYVGKNSLGCLGKNWQRICWKEQCQVSMSKSMQKML